MSRAKRKFIFFSLQFKKQQAAIRNDRGKPMGINPQKKFKIFPALKT